MTRLYVGIDNGSSGGIGVVTDRGTLYRADRMPATDVEVLAILQTLAVPGQSSVEFAVLEFAQAFPKMGTSSAFNYGKGYGAMQMALVAAGIRFDIVVPRKWQAAMSCLSGRDKNVTKRRAEQLFPGFKITHAVADALLIAEFCRRSRGQHGEEERRAQQNSEARQGGQLEEFAARGVSAQRAVDQVLEQNERQRKPFDGYNPPGRTRRRKGPA